MKIISISVLSLIMGFFLGAFYGRRDIQSNLEKLGLTSEETYNAIRKMPDIHKELSVADDNLGTKLAILYKLNISGQEEKSKARLKEMLEEYYAKISSDSSPSESRKIIIEKVRLLLDTKVNR